jgi:hypothetical protein
VQEIAPHNQYGIKSFLHQIIEGSTVGVDFADVVDQPLHLVGMCRFLLVHYRGHTNDLCCCRDMEEEGLVRLCRAEDRWLGCRT